MTANNRRARALPADARWSEASRRRAREMGSPDEGRRQGPALRVGDDDHGLASASPRHVDGRLTAASTRNARFHLDERTDEYVRSGMSPARRARQAALRRFGSAALANERTRDADTVPLASRSSPRHRLRATHAATQSRVLRCWRSSASRSGSAPTPRCSAGSKASSFVRIRWSRTRTGCSRWPGPIAARPATDDVSWPDWLDLQRNSTLVDAFIAREDHRHHAQHRRPRRARARKHGLGELLRRDRRAPDARARVRARRGLGRNAHPVTVISYQMWQERFHGDPAVIGRTQLLNGLPHTIVGVAPEGFYGTFVGYAFQFWVPASMQAQFDAGGYKLEDRGARWIEGFVRLKPGVTIEQAQAEMSAIAGAARGRLPGHEPRPRRPAVSAVADAVQRRGRAAPDARHRARRRRCPCCSSRARTSATCCSSGRSRGGRR